MQIIKISPKSFKVILSKEYLLTDTDFENNAFYENLLRKIINEISEREGVYFSRASKISAEMFDCSDGSAEMFISCDEKITSYKCVYLFETKECDALFSLCGRLCFSSLLPFSSELYYQNKSYFLSLYYENESETAKAIISEYGSVKKASLIRLLQLSEHAKLICPSNAINLFASQVKKASDTPL